MALDELVRWRGPGPRSEAGAGGRGAGMPWASVRGSPPPTQVPVSFTWKRRGDGLRDGGLGVAGTGHEATHVPPCSRERPLLVCTPGVSEPSPARSSRANGGLQTTVLRERPGSDSGLLPDS